MVVLITGSSGFVGKNLTKKLKNLGWSVIGMDYVDYLPLNVVPTQEQVKLWLDEFGMDGFIKYRLGSYESKQITDAILEKLNGVTHIVHLASQSHVDRSIQSPNQFILDNVSGTLELFELSRNLPNLKEIILFGTDEVVACLEDGEATEKSLMNCGSVYSASKGAQELLAQSYIKMYNLPIHITRCVNIFGPYQAEEKFIPKIISSCIKDEKIPIYGSGYQTREWVHVEHVCEVISWLLMNSIVPHGTILHITGTKEISNIFLANYIASTFSKSQLIEHVADRVGHDERYALGKGDSEILWDMPIYKNRFVNDLLETIKWYKEKYGSVTI